MKDIKGRVKEYPNYWFIGIQISAQIIYAKKINAIKSPQCKQIHLFFFWKIRCDTSKH